VENFFVSYNKADKGWAEWIAWCLEEAGYTTIIQAWDFRPGNNFVLEMQEASAKAERTIAVLSPDYVSSKFTQPEWAAAFAKDPTGEKGLLIPVRVKEGTLEGLLPQIIYIDLVELKEDKAKDALLNGVKQQRAKPANKPNFPQQIIEKWDNLQKPVFPTGQQIPVPIIQPPLNEVVGRDNLVDEIINDLNAGKAVQLWGMPGVGKSTLAAYIGSKLDKPKGGFLLDVRVLFSSGAARLSREGKLSLEILIRACVEAFGGSTGSNPLTEAQNLFMDSERLLILDNLDDADLAREFITQVRPKSLIITARSNYQSSLANYGISRKVELISLDESIQQFRKDSQVTSGFDSSITEICSPGLLDRLPLAVNIVASQIRAEIWKDPEDLLIDLRRKKLDVIQDYQSQTSKDNARIAFQISYEQLTSELNETFLELGVLSPVGASTYSVAWMLDKDVEDTRRILNELKRRALVQSSEEDRYHCHNLLWEFARDESSKNSSLTTLETKFIGLLDHLSNCFVGSVSVEISPESNFKEVGKHWEQGVWGIKQYANTIPEDKMLSLINGLYNYIFSFQGEVKSLDLFTTLLDFALRKGNPNLERIALANIGRVFLAKEQFDEALTYFERSLEIAESLEWELKNKAITWSKANIADLYYAKGRIEKAEEYIQKAETIYIDALVASTNNSATSDIVAESHIIEGLAAINHHKGNPEIAIACWIYAFCVYLYGDSIRGRGVLINLARMRIEMGEENFDEMFMSIFDRSLGDMLLSNATGMQVIYRSLDLQPIEMIEDILGRVRNYSNRVSQLKSER
jgi:tetratricopeptide (TPR) repeat protein